MKKHNDIFHGLTHIYPPRNGHVFLSVILALALFFTAVLCPEGAYAKEKDKVKTVKVAVEDSAIFIMTDKKGNPVSGYAYEYIENIAAYANWNVEYVFCGSFSDCLDALKSGKVDMFYDVSLTEERMEWLAYPDVPMGTEEFYLFCLADNKEIHYDDYSTLSGKKAGVTEGTIEKEELELWSASKGIELNIVEYDSDPAKESAFEAGLVDLEYEISVLAKDNFSALAKISGSDYYLAAQKGREDLIDDINTAYAKIESVNKYFLEHLNEKYFGKSVLNMTLSQDEADWVAEHDTLKVGYMDDYMPFSDTEDNGEPDGIVKDIIPQMLSNIGIEDELTVEYIGYLNNEEMFAALSNDEIDVVFPIIDNIEFSTSNNLLSTLEVINLSADIVYKDTFNDRTISTIAVNKYNRFQDFYTRICYPNAGIIYCGSTEDCLLAVAEGRAGSTILNGLRTANLLSEKTGKDLSSFRLAQPFGFSFAVNKGNSALLSIFNRTIGSMDSGLAYNYAYNYTDFYDDGSIVSYIQEHKIILMTTAIVILMLILVIAIIVAVVMAKTKRKLAEANTAKTSFLFNMSHDIRTPMNAILGFTDMAKKNIDDRGKLSDCLDKTQQAGNLLLSLINSVLEMSRIESGKAQLNEAPGFVDYVFSDIRSTMMALADQKHIDLKFELGDIKDHYVYVDIDRNNRVMTNIISNAIKYTQNGGYVRVRCEQDGCVDEEHGRYRFIVEDNGIGISEEFQKKIFDEFSRENTTTVSGIQGSGLGLSVAKSFVDLMHGTIECRSKQGEGTTFIVTLPLKLQKNNAGARYIDPVTKEIVDVVSETESGTKEDAVLSGRRVLIVEDNEMNREIAAFILEEEEIIVEEADDGTTAVEMLKEKGPDYYDAVLMDIQMPVMNGYDATKAIRAMYPDSKLPIIALSANAFAEDKAASIAAGMNDHIAKPINSAELFAAMKKLM